MFRVVQGCSGFRVQGPGFRVQGSGSRVQGLGFSLERKEKRQDINKKREGKRELSLLRGRGSVFEKNLPRLFLIFCFLAFLFFFSFFLVFLFFLIFLCFFVL